jgi:uncharacterized protein (TIRG00374 family)
VLEVASNAAYSALTARIIGPKRLSYFTALRIDAADLGVNHVVPGGGATAAAVRFRLFVRAGVPTEEALSGAALEITISNLALGALFAIGLAISLSALGSNDYYVVALAAVAVLFAGVIAAGWALERHMEGCVRFARWVGRHLRHVGSDGAELFARSVARRVHVMVHQPRRLWINLALATSNWLLDAAALWVMLAAFGHVPSVGTLLAVYGLGSILAMLPLTPGGLGLVEGVMVPAFAAFGVPAGAALLAVVGWRVLEYWLPIPVAAIAYSSLRLGERRSARRVRAA